MRLDDGATLIDSPDGATNVTSGGGSDSATHDREISSPSEKVPFSVTAVNIGGLQTKSFRW